MSIVHTRYSNWTTEELLNTAQASPSPFVQELARRLDMSLTDEECEVSIDGMCLSELVVEKDHGCAQVENLVIRLRDIVSGAEALREEIENVGNNVATVKASQVQCPGCFHVHGQSRTEIKNLTDSYADLMIELDTFEAQLKK